jgi:hypothetical protein
VACGPYLFPIPVPYPEGLPLLPKVKRPIRQRQPFDIYEDQYQTLKKISEAEREFVNGRSMSQMVRQAIDDYASAIGLFQEILKTGLRARTIGNANLARRHDKEFAARKLVRVLLEHGIELFDFGLKAGSG